MLVPDASLLILLLIVLLIHVLEDLQEAAIIRLQDGVLGGQVKWPAIATVLGCPPVKF